MSLRRAVLAALVACAVGSVVAASCAAGSVAAASRAVGSVAAASRAAGSVAAASRAAGSAGPPLAAQTLSNAHPGLARHRDAVAAERVDLLHRALLAADGEARARGAAALERLRGARAPALAAPTREQLDRWRRALEAPVDPDAEALERFADAVDLMVVPGAFQAAATAADADRVTVRVFADPRAARPRTGTLRLYWRGADGERTLARTAGFEAGAFVAPGFDLYLRAPVGPPGRWWLEPEVEADGRVARGPGVPVDGVRDLDARWEALSRAPGSGGEDVRRGDFELLLIAGARTARGDAAEALLAHLEGAAPGGLAEPFDAGVDERAWVLGSAQARGPVLVVVAAPDAAAGGVLAGERGRAWRAALERLDGTLVALPSTAARGPVLAASLARCRERFGPRPLVLVPRGSSAALALLGSGAAGGDDVWWVLPRTGPVEPGGGGLRGLLIGPAALGPLGDESRFALVDRPSWPFATELELPTLVADWWSARDAGDAPR